MLCVFYLAPYWRIITVATVLLIKPRCQHRPSVLYLLKDFYTFPGVNTGSGLASTSCFWENLFHVLSLSSPIQVPFFLSHAELTLYTTPSFWITWKNYPCGALMCNSLYCICENAQGGLYPSRANILHGKQKKMKQSNFQSLQCGFPLIFLLPPFSFFWVKKNLINQFIFCLC